MKLLQFFKDILIKIWRIIPEKVLNYLMVQLKKVLPNIISSRFPEAVSGRIAIVFSSISWAVIAVLIICYCNSGEKEESDEGISKIDVITKHLNSGISMKIKIHGKNNDKANIRVYNDYGDFVSFELNAESKMNGTVYNSGPQRLIINSIFLISPKESGTGYIILNCSFSDDFGNGLQSFSGKIASWKPN